MRFFYVVENKNYSDAQSMLRRNVCSPNMCYLGVYPLNVAVENGDVDMVSILLSAGADAKKKGTGPATEAAKTAEELATAMSKDKKCKLKDEAALILKLMSDKEACKQRFEGVQVKIKKMDDLDKSRSIKLLSIMMPIVAAYAYYMIYIAPTIKTGDDFMVKIREAIGM